MPSVTVTSATGGKGSKLNLNDEVFAAPVKKVLIREALNNHMANKRSGNAATKDRSEIVGSGRKPFRQKGTGRARQGTVKAPHMRGGGVAFGPKPRDYSYKLGRKKKRLAITGMLSNFLESERLIVVDKFPIETPKTSEMLAFLSGLEVKGKILVLTDTDDKAVLLSSRNVKASGSKSIKKRDITEIRARAYNNINIFDLLVCDYLVGSVAAIEKVQEMYK